MLRGWCTSQVRPVRLRGNSTRQVRPPGRPIRPSCAGGDGVPGRQDRQAGEATRQVRPVRPPCAGGAGYQKGKQVRLPGRRGWSGHHVRELGGCAGQARPAGYHVLGGGGRLDCAGGRSASQASR